MLLHNCIPCQHGHHEQHMPVIQMTPGGMMGGAQCPCDGECTHSHISSPASSDQVNIMVETQFRSLIQQLR